MEKRKKQSTPTNYSEAFKRQVVSEFESGLSSKATLKRKYAISVHSCVDRWLEKYGKLEHPKYSTIGRPMKDKDKQYIKELEAKLRVKEKHLEKQLKRKEAELLAYKQFIKIAERELNIKIVKKSGTKQSKK
jgi:transposase